MEKSAKKFSYRYPHFVRIIVICTLLLVMVGISGWSANLFAHASAQKTSTSSQATSYPVQIFFSKYPDSVNKNPTLVYPVNRTSPTLAVGTFAIQLLIAGPTLDEQKVGYFSELNSILSGPSQCTAANTIAGPDFTLTLNKKGSQNSAGTVTLMFCRTTLSTGVGSDARITAEIDATLKQFSTVKNVVILTKDGHCFGDESGQDRCLR